MYSKPIFLHYSFFLMPVKGGFTNTALFDKHFIWILSSKDLLVLSLFP